MKLLQRFIPGVFISVISYAAAQTYTWRNVTISGGGFVTGIVAGKTQQSLMYTRTDAGRAYRTKGKNAAVLTSPLKVDVPAKSAVFLAADKK